MSDRSAARDAGSDGRQRIGPLGIVARLLLGGYLLLAVLGTPVPDRVDASMVLGFVGFPALFARLAVVVDPAASGTGTRHRSSCECGEYGSGRRAVPDSVVPAGAAVGASSTKTAWCASGLARRSASVSAVYAICSSEPTKSVTASALPRQAG